jgi:uncharacterized protein (DUF302 family)
MMRSMFVPALVLVLAGGVNGSAAAVENGLVSKKSPYSVRETVDRLEAALKAKGIAVALRWSHDEQAKGVDMALRPTELIVFGNPKLGTPLMTSHQSAGLDLPLKALAWQDEAGQVWLTYSDPAYIAARHGVNDRAEIVAKITQALEDFSNQAVAK